MITALVLFLQLMFGHHTAAAAPIADTNISATVNADTANYAGQVQMAPAGHKAYCVKAHTVAGHWVEAYTYTNRYGTVVHVKRHYVKAHTVKAYCVKAKA